LDTPICRRACASCNPNGICRRPRLAEALCKRRHPVTSVLSLLTCDMTRVGRSSFRARASGSSAHATSFTHCPTARSHKTVSRPTLLVGRAGATPRRLRLALTAASGWPPSTSPGDSASARRTGALSWAAPIAAKRTIIRSSGLRPAALSLPEHPARWYAPRYWPPAVRMVRLVATTARRRSPNSFTRRG
jgi:hypothetical protein